MFSRRVWPFKKSQTPPESLALENVSSGVFAAGDTIEEWEQGPEGAWQITRRPITQAEADTLNHQFDEEDEHALEALAGVDDRLRGWPLVLSWTALFVGSWAIMLTLGYGLYRLLVWMFGGVP